VAVAEVEQVGKAAEREREVIYPLTAFIYLLNQ